MIVSYIRLGILFHFCTDSDKSYVLMVVVNFKLLYPKI